MRPWMLYLALLLVTVAGILLWYQNRAENQQQKTVVGPPPAQKAAVVSHDASANKGHASPTPPTPSKPYNQLIRRGSETFVRPAFEHHPARDRQPDVNTKRPLAESDKAAREDRDLDGLGNYDPGAYLKPWDPAKGLKPFDPVPYIKKHQLDFSEEEQ